MAVGWKRVRRRCLSQIRQESGLQPFFEGKGSRAKRSGCYLLACLGGTPDVKLLHFGLNLIRQIQGLSGFRPSVAHSLGSIPLLSPKKYWRPPPAASNGLSKSLAPPPGTAVAAICLEIARFQRARPSSSSPPTSAGTRGHGGRPSAATIEQVTGTASRRNKAFLDQYRGARADHLAGREAVFPPGTWWLCRFAGLRSAEAVATAPPS